ncbi:MAG: putative polysaccharide biosynthesis protein [Bacillota bacterium]
MRKIKSQSLIKGTIILMIAGVINKIFGFGLRMYLVRVIGDEGLGLFQMVFPIFVTSSIIITLGLPIAVTKFVSRNTAKGQYNKALQVFELSIITVCLSGLAVTFLFVKQANLIADLLLQDQRTYYLLLAIAPALFFTGLASIIRGFFQGLRIMTPTAISRIIEQIARLLATILILLKLATASLEFKVTGVAIGVSIGETVGFITLVLIFFYYLPQLKEQDSQVVEENKLSLLTRLIKFGIPITCSRLIASLMYTLEAITIPGQLQQAGFSTSNATSFYGQLSGMVQQLILLPTIMTIALKSNLIPAVSEALADNNKASIRNKAQQAIRLTFYSGFLAVIILFLVPRQICELLFDYPQAGNILRVLATTAVFLYLAQIFSSILQGLGQPNKVVRNSVIALVVELLIIQSVVYLPQSIALLTICLAIGARFLVTAGLHFFTINHKVKLRLPLEHLFFKPLLAGLAVCVILPLLNNFLLKVYESNLISLGISLTVSSILYLAILIMTKGITKKDWQQIIN